MRDDFFVRNPGQETVQHRGAAELHVFPIGKRCAESPHRLSTTSCRDAASISLRHLYERRSRVPVAMHDCYEGRCGWSEFLWFFPAKNAIFEAGRTLATTYCRESRRPGRLCSQNFHLSFHACTSPKSRPQNRGNYFSSFALAEENLHADKWKRYDRPRMHARFRTSTRTRGPDMARNSWLTRIKPKSFTAGPSRLGAFFS